MSNINYWYHRTMAAVLNWRASRASKLLRNVGSRSNHHERERDRIKARMDADR